MNDGYWTFKHDGTHILRMWFVPSKQPRTDRRKTRAWMHACIWESGISPHCMHNLRYARISLQSELDCVHSSKTRPFTLSIIHARINARTPGSMLAARRAGRVG